MAQARKVALRASKGMLDQATRGEKKLKVSFFSRETKKNNSSLTDYVLSMEFCLS